jgi:hypothetical protein
VDKTIWTAFDSVGYLNARVAGKFEGNVVYCWLISGDVEDKQLNFARVRHALRTANSVWRVSISPCFCLNWRNRLWIICCCTVVWLHKLLVDSIALVMCECKENPCTILSVKYEFQWSKLILKFSVYLPLLSLGKGSSKAFFPISVVKAVPTISRGCFLCKHFVIFVMKFDVESFLSLWCVVEIVFSVQIRKELTLYKIQT